jgi:mRNA-degrading endonuclease toxin of MazEF toxin-antitoxin module
MSDDYLWDRTGEPDTDVQELENVLGTLRYQPKPFVLPEDAQVVSPRKWFPLMAIAAAIALLALAMGIWIKVQRQNTPQPVVARSPKTGNKNATAELPTPTPTEPKKSPEAPKHKFQMQNSLALVRHVNKPAAARFREEMNAANRAEAEAAKEQLMLALRVVSAKLSLAQRKAVPVNNTRYQHKIG